MRTITVTVRVVDEFGNPVDRAHLFISKSNGAVTNSNGFASITGNAYDSLTISHMGKKPEKFTLQNTPKELVLREDFADLDEVIITAAGRPKPVPDAPMPKYLIPAVGGFALLLILMSMAGSEPKEITL